MRSRWREGGHTGMEHMIAFLKGVLIATLGAVYALGAVAAYNSTTAAYECYTGVPRPDSVIIGAVGWPLLAPILGSIMLLSGDPGIFACAHPQHSEKYQ